MGLGELVARLERDVDARIAQIRAKATADVEAIDSETGRLSEARRQQALAGRRAARRAVMHAELARARAEVRAARLDAEQHLLSRVRARARALLLSEATSKAAQRAIAASFREALRYVEGLSIVVSCRADLLEVLQPLCAAPEALGSARFEPSADAPPGFTLATSDGALRIDATLVSQLDSRWPLLAMGILRDLSPSRGETS